MLRSLVLRRVVKGSAPLLLALCGCSGDGSAAPGSGPGGEVPGSGPGVEVPAACPDGNEIAGACAGAPLDAICNEDACSAGVSCSSVVSASDDASLTAAAAGAKEGACITVAPGTYGDVVLPGGVSLLGRGAASVTVGHVVLGAGGSGAVLRGVTVAGGVEVLGASAEITSSSIKNSAGAGITVGAGASLTVKSSAITGSATHGVSAFDAASVAIETSIISGSSGPGLWAQCASGCDCAAPSTLSVKKSILRDNKIVGVSVVGVAATLEGVDVRDNSEAPDFKGSGGISASGCSTLSASSVRVLDNSAFGILVDGASAMIGGPNADQAVEVSRNFMGVWIQNVTEQQPVKLDGVTMLENQAVGLGTTGESRGIICWNSAISGTKLVTIPVLANGSAASQEVGDGLVWLGYSQMQLDHLTLSGNARASILIDGSTAPGSSLAHITLSGGDEDKGILQQNAKSGVTPTPETSTDSPEVTTSAVEAFSVPVGPAVPSSN
jgi:hypothetical protein